MPEIMCAGATEADGTKVCSLHNEPLVDRQTADLRGFTRDTPNLGAQWFCPVSGKALGDFGEEDAYLNQAIGSI